MKKPPHATVPLILVDRNGDKPLHRQIYDALRAMILETRYPHAPRTPACLHWDALQHVPSGEKHK